MNTVQLERNPLRPSSLDNLDRCNWYKSTPSERTKRGSYVDDCLRQWLPDRTTPLDELNLAADCLLGFRYAADKTLEIVGQDHFVVAKKGCEIAVPGFPLPAECDCKIPGKLTSIDWKSGGKWDYYRQQAAYAYGQMVANFAMEWTCVCVYYDQQETTWHRFTFREAKEVVETAAANYANPQPPTPNEFCPWCANFNICPAQRELAGNALAIPEGALDFQAVLADPELTGKFLAGCHALDKYDKEAREAALSFMMQAKQVPYFGYSKGKKSYFVPVETIIHIATHDVPKESALARLTTIVKAAGPISKDAYEKICLIFGLDPDPTHIKEQMGQPFVRYTGNAKPKE